MRTQGRTARASPRRRTLKPSSTAPLSSCGWHAAISSTTAIPITSKRVSRLAQAATRRSACYRRLPSLAMYWSDEGLICFEFRSRRRRIMVPEVLEVLWLMERWVTVAQFATRHPDFGSQRDIRQLFEALVDANLVQRAGAVTEWAWSEWQPEAAFFHFGTRGGSYPADLSEHDRRLIKKAKKNPPPPPTKAIQGPVVPLPYRRGWVTSRGHYASGEPGEISRSGRSPDRAGQPAATHLGCKSGATSKGKAGWR